MNPSGCHIEKGRSCLGFKAKSVPDNFSTDYSCKCLNFYFFTGCFKKSKTAVKQK